MRVLTAYAASLLEEDIQGVRTLGRKTLGRKTLGS